jgi:hypothetical protein
MSRSAIRRVLDIDPFAFFDAAVRADRTRLRESRAVQAPEPEYLEPSSGEVSAPARRGITLTRFDLEEEFFMLGKVLIAVGTASVLFLFAGPTVAKDKAKQTTKPPHIYSQPECTGMKKMHWDDATQTCQKNK